MNEENKKPKIKIVRNGPYLVSGNVPLAEKIIFENGSSSDYRDGRSLPQAEGYALCRCGKSKNPPFCDDSHEKTVFSGRETASMASFEQRAYLFEGPGIDLLDDNRCAYARFCHREGRSVWELTELSGYPEYREEAIKAACNCPSGRLVAVDKTGRAIEPEYAPSIEILQDAEEGVSAGIFVKGNIPIESSNGETYEVRNRQTLCRCGKSRNMPFCDATHVDVQFSDKTTR